MSSDGSGVSRGGRLCALLSVGCLVACQGQAFEGDDGVASAEAPVLGENGLTTNGLTTNGLTTNGLTTNGLTTNGLTASTLVALRDKTATGDLTRMFFRYMVACALPAGHAVTYSWTDRGGAAHSETAGGQFNLAPDWEDDALDLAGQELVSACLFARTNALGISVPISMRGDGSRALAVGAQERADYTYGEGAFWGNLFASTKYGFSCSRTPFCAGARTSADLQNGRVCAAQGCGIITYVGPCFASNTATRGQACFRKSSNNDWVSDCNASMMSANAANSHVITTWLRP